MGAINELENVVEEVRKEMCDDYCKYPHECKDEEELNERCNNCPMCRI